MKQTYKYYEVHPMIETEKKWVKVTTKRWLRKPTENWVSFAWLEENNLLGKILPLMERM